ncbi:MAG: hypothetical protein OXU19_09795 [bacterium]|nr:hypothetical protein [bacterium]
MTEETVATQVIANLVVTDRDGHVLFVRHDPDSEKWWLPGRDVEPYTHPDDTAGAVLADLTGLETVKPEFDHVESFRGRRGWHLVFHYRVRAKGRPVYDALSQWYPAEDLPVTAHGGWEKAVVKKLTGG